MKSRGLRIKGDDTPIAPGEWRDVDVPSGAIRDNILPLPYKEPSQVLNQLMNQIVEEGRRFASAADMKVSDMSANSPVGTTLAILERTLKVMSAVQARIYYAMKQEFKLLAGIIKDYTPEEYSYEPEVGSSRAKQSDYDCCDVIPVSDPNAATMSQKVVQYQAVMQMAQQNPQIYDLPELNKQMLEVLGVKNIGKLIPTADDQKPKDPVSENMAIINGKPVKAFLYQDHEAHIKVHMAAMQDPKIAQLIGQNPMAQQLQAAAMAHINEHVAFAYRQQIEKQLGASLPAPDDELPQTVEVELSKLTAQAAEQLLQLNQKEVAQKQAQEQAQDPLIQMQQQELAIKQQEVQIKAQKSQADIELDRARLILDKEKIDSQERIEGAKLGAKAMLDKEQLEATQHARGVELGLDLLKAQNSQDHNSDMKDKDHNMNKEMQAMQQMMQQAQQSQTEETPQPTEETPQLLQE
jgi:hypothetical protein